ncbi:unnamed protein product [Penicillium salamii]|uniref:Uncharacterized protein n=1 Tax=Penicillium salamii TaxID=1612424 RepID=A0A9W4JTP7_9EURO|nr:unnamed protein product [Penicillium salamii]CAG8412014.1 unnamed protein product [Penicillium salamii]CAG8412192.1 unnamed protein product [Penicillium salamii]
MSSITGALVRRGTEAAFGTFQEKKPDQPNGGLVALFAMTVLVLGLVFWSVEYTYGMVVATLAAVEDTNPDIYVRITSNPDPTKPNDEEAELAVPNAQPITNKLRTTVKHLRARAGFWSRFRGAGMFLAYTGMNGFLFALVPVNETSFVYQFIIQSFVGVALATWQMAWVHIVITEPSPKRFWQRIPSYKTWIKIAPAAALENVLISAAFFLPMALAKLFGWLEPTASDDVPPMIALYRFMGATIIPAILSFMISMPARVIFIRVAASMLPEEDETIVPFDRSFGGKVSPAITGGSGKIGLMDAWTTFDWAARVRFAKVIGKTFAIQVALVVLASLVLGGQVILMFKTAKPAGSDAPGYQISYES